MKLGTFGTIAGWLTCFVILNILVKNLSLSTSRESFIEQVLAMAKLPTFYMAATLYGSCALLYFFALSRLPLSTAGPMFMVLGVVSTTLIGISIFGETMAPLKLAGLAVCLTGIGMLFFNAP
jgi:multidrug transporter EmrE-like cation transporter